MQPVTGSRQRPVEAAQHLFYASSYSEVGVQQICDLAGARKGSTRHLFPSRRDLTLAALDQGANLQGSARRSRRPGSYPV